MLQIVDGSGVHTVLGDQRIGSDLLARHRFPERFITDHDPSPAFKKIFLLSFEKWGFTILKKVSIMDIG